MSILFKNVIAFSLSVFFAVICKAYLPDLQLVPPLLGVLYIVKNCKQDIDRLVIKVISWLMK